MWMTYRKLWELFDPRGRLAVLGLFVLMLVAALIEAFAVASVMPLVTGVTRRGPHGAPGGHWAWVDRLGMGGGDSNVLMIVFSVAVVGSIILKVLAEYASMDFSSSQNVRWSRRLLRVHLNSDYDWFLGRHSAEIGYGLLGRVQEVVAGSLLPGLRVIVNLLVALFIFAVMMRSLPNTMLFGVVAIIVIYCGIYIALRNRFSAIGVEKEKTSATRFRLIGEIFGGIKEIKLYGLESVYEERTREPFERHAVLLCQRHLLGILPRYLFEAIGFVALYLIVVVMRGSGESMTTILPKLGLFGFAAYRLLPAIQQIYQNAMSLPTGLPALATLHDDLLSGNDALPTQPVPLELHNEIALREARYCYPGATSASVDTVDLKIAARTMVALVGKSGAGKSTLADLTIGLLALDAGSLAIDQVELDSAGRRAWRANCAYVPQQVFLLDDTIAANIAFGVPEHLQDMAKIEAAAKAAALHEFVSNSLPEGYSTRIGERGVRLSGGQRQRIGIARALYRDVDYLVLDEATNALDPGTEAEVMVALDQLKGTRTVLVIAHRLSTVERCDRVLLVEDGRIVADGSYDELLRNEPLFQKFANAGNIDNVLP